MSLKTLCGGDAAKWPRRCLKELDGIFKIIDTFDVALYAIVIPIQGILPCWPTREKSKIKINRNQPYRRRCAKSQRDIQIFGLPVGKMKSVDYLRVVCSDRREDGDHIVW